MKLKLMNAKMKLIGIMALITLQHAVFVSATPTIIDDNTPGTATLDGVIGVDEYADHSDGINIDFGGFLGTGSYIYLDSGEDGKINIGHQINQNLSNVNINNRYAVMYIDAGNGGTDLTSLSALWDSSTPYDSTQQAIAGKNESATNNIEFASGFGADYAIAWNNIYAGLYSLEPGIGLIELLAISPFSYNNYNIYEIWGAMELEFNISQLGLSPGDSFRYVITCLNLDMYRSSEFHGVVGFPENPEGYVNNAGFMPGSTVVLSDGDFNTFNSYQTPASPDSNPVPEPASLVLVSTGILSLVSMKRRRRRI